MARILVLSSHVAQGGVGLKATVAPMHNAGVDAIALPTTLLSNHPGHARFAGGPVEVGRLRAMTEALEKNGIFAELTAVFAGYMPSTDHVAWARATIDAVRARNPQAIVIVDPILGDDPGGLYVAESIARAIRDDLLPVSDIATPNRFELQWLTGEPSADIAGAATAARTLGRPCVAATSIPGPKERLANVLVTEAGVSVAEVAKQASAPHGTGDLFAGIFAAEVIQNASFAAALAYATGAVAHAMAVSGTSDELELAAIDWQNGIKPARVAPWP